MKTTLITLAAIFTLISNVLVAANDYINTTPSPAINTAVILSLAPATPSVATFEETAMTVDFAQFVPTVPSAAAFDDAVSPGLPENNFAPALPGEADFE